MSQNVWNGNADDEQIQQERDQIVTNDDGYEEAVDGAVKEALNEAVEEAAEERVKEAAEETAGEAAVEETHEPTTEEQDDVDNVLSPAGEQAEEHADDYFGPFETGTGGSHESVTGGSQDDGDNGRSDSVEVDAPRTPVRQRPRSDTESLSIPDDSPSVQDSRLSSPGLAALPGPAASPLSRKHALRTTSGALQPFERRFESRLSSSPVASPRVSSPGFLSPGSRQFSLTSQLSPGSSQGGADSDEPNQAPWDVIRWTRLRKVTSQVYSETGRRNFGRPTCLAVSALIAVGTSKGFVLGFDYHQTLKIIMGPGTKAAECGSVTALAISADYSTICSGHRNGHIFTWEINRPARPFLQIPPIDRAALTQPQHPNGHVAGSAILHIGFLGMRHTAIVSADSSGMAFSHLASRGLGPVTRTVSTTRLLGRYPQADTRIDSRKPSSVLAFSPLPLGNVEQPTDQMGLTALLTPYLLVIVSTTPTAQTQHKVSRPKEVSPHSTLSGCLAWFPSVKLKGAGRIDKDASDAKLAYCWSNVLSVLDVRITAYDPKDSQRPPSLEFATRSRWRAEEPIVAVQWLGRSILSVLTISQRLLIIEDGSIQVTDSLDLLQRHIYHQDLFSQQLRPVVEQLDADDPTLHGVVADAFYMSFKAYKGRLFILSFNDLAIGTLSNWADRLVALMEAGDHIAAIRLATDYYTGSANNVTIALPDNDESRHEMVRERLLAMITASLQYTFAQTDEMREDRLRELAEACCAACTTSEETEFLTSQVFEFYDESDEQAMFILALEPYILDGEISRLPADVVKSMVSYFVSENQAARLEELLCRLEPHSFDLDEMTIICKQHNLYDALIFMWTQAMRDFVTPLTDLFQLIKLIDGQADTNQDNPFFEPATKVFPYLAFSLTGRTYPRGDQMPEDEASQARTDLYGFLFSGRALAWPQGSQQLFHTTASKDSEPAFPYLTLLLNFDAVSFLSMLNEAFEDPSLNEVEGSSQVNGFSHSRGSNRRSGIRFTRQHIISIMLDVMRHNESDAEDVIYLDMFIARNLAKYPTQLVLSGSLLNSILERLCHPPSSLLHEDCQLSVEYLLSTYQPPDTSSLVENLKQAKFYKVLKTIYRRQKRFLDLFEVYFEDAEDKASVFEALPAILSTANGIPQKQMSAIKASIVKHANDLAEIDTVRLVRVIANQDVSLLEPIVSALHTSSYGFIFLRTLFEPALLHDKCPALSLQSLARDGRIAFEEQYVQLMCKHEPAHVADYVTQLQSGDLRLAEVLPSMEDSGVVDAEVMLLTRDGSFLEAMNRLVRHLQSLRQTLISLLDTAYESPDIVASGEAAESLLQEVTKYTRVGIWLCQQSSKAVDRKPHKSRYLTSDVSEDSLDLDEHLWLDLIDTLVQLTQKVSQAIQYLDDHPSTAHSSALDTTELHNALRPNIQQAFTSLLVSTSDTVQARALVRDNRRARSAGQLSFLRILRCFLQRAATSAPSLSDLRDVLADIFAAYAFEQDMLTMANELLGADVFSDIQNAHELRQQGWRPRTQVCEGCKRRAWGPGIGEVVWDEYVGSELDRTSKKARKALERGGTEEAKRLERGKGRLSALVTHGLPSPAVAPDPERRRLSLVVFACRHVYHRVCLDPSYKEGRLPGIERYHCPLCTVKSSP